MRVSLRLASGLVLFLLAACGAFEGINDGISDSIEDRDFDPFCIGGMTPPPGGGLGGDGWGHCLDNTGAVCTAVRYGDSATPDQARDDFAASCPDAADGDIGTYGEGRCPTAGGISQCTSASGPLESTGEYVEFQFVFYEEACGRYSDADMSGTCDYYTGAYSTLSSCP